jgi:hypothetical protein
MFNYVLIEIDTASPDIDIYIPPYTTIDLINEIIIQANENLEQYQEIYVIDSHGSRFDYTFELERDRLVGLVNFGNLSLGVATIYARVKDEVGNISNLVSKSFVLKESLTLLKLEVKDIQMLIDNEEFIASINTNITESSRININEKEMNIEDNHSVRKVIIKDGNR